MTAPLALCDQYNIIKIPHKISRMTQGIISQENQCPFVSDCYNRHIHSTFPREKKNRSNNRISTLYGKNDFLSTFLSCLCEMLKMAFYYIRNESRRDCCFVFLQLSFLLFRKCWVRTQEDRGKYQKLRRKIKEAFKKIQVRLMN